MYDYDVSLNHTNATKVAMAASEEVKNASSVYGFDVVAVSDQALLLGADDTDIEMFDVLNNVEYNTTRDNSIFTYDETLSGDLYYTEDLYTTSAPPPPSQSTKPSIPLSTIAMISAGCAVVIGLIGMYTVYGSKKNVTQTPLLPPEMQGETIMPQFDTCPERLNFCDNPLHK